MPRIFRVFNCSLPLLGRELVESANRRRTYVVRMLFVLLALTIFGLAFETLSQERIEMFGLGMMVLRPLIMCMYAVIFVLLPAMAASSVTQEKEQGTLILLLLTPMGPSQLILQKFLSIALMMVVLLLGCLPLMGVTYILGGMNSRSIWYFSLGIILTIVEVSAIGLAVGSWCRRSAGATILSYLLIAGIFLLEMISEYGGMNSHGVLAFLHGFIPSCCPWTISYDSRSLPGAAVMVPLLITLAALIFARVMLVRRSSLEGGQGILKFLRLLDRGFDRMDTSLMRRRRQRDLPLDQPVWWLEINRRSLSNLRYLVRIFLPIYGFIILLSTALPERVDEIYGWFMGLLLLPLIVVHASALAQERGQQTLEVLLTTPLSGMNFLRQKSRALSRLRWAATGCLMIPVLVHQNYVHFTDQSNSFSDYARICAAVLLPAICCWIAMLIGVAVRSSRKAAIAALLTCAAWLVGVPILLALVTKLFFTEQLDTSWSSLACPIVLLADGPYAMRNLINQVGLSWMIVSLLAYVGLWWGLRWVCLNWGSRWLYRSGAAASG